MRRRGSLPFAGHPYLASSTPLRPAAVFPRRDRYAWRRRRSQSAWAPGSGHTAPRRAAARLLTPHPPAIAGARARNRFLKLIRTTGTRFLRRKGNDNSAAFLLASLIYFCSGKPTGACVASTQRQHRLSWILWNRQARRPSSESDELLPQLSNLPTTPKRVEHPDLRGCGTRKKARKNPPGPSSFPVEGGISSPYRPCHPFHRQAYRATHFPSSAFRRPWLPW